MTDRYIGSRLFLSCDLVGSTGYKQRRGEPWVPYFLEFYNEFPALVSSRIAQADDRDLDIRELTLWKAVGDELIFSYDVSKSAQVNKLVRIWVAAMDEYQRATTSRLPTKGSAFLATFPLPDREVAIRRNGFDVSDNVEAANEAAFVDRADGFVFDYLGPSVDTGFRVAELSDERFFAMSLEVAWAFAHAELLCGRESSADLRLLGTYELKGVWHGREYPVFALDRLIANDDPVTLALNALTGTLPTSHANVLGLAEACHEDSSWPCRIYLPTDDGYEPFWTERESLVEAAADLDDLANQRRMDLADVRQEQNLATLDDDAPLY